MLTRTIVALPTNRTTGRRDSALDVLTQPFRADKVHSYQTTLILQPIILDRWSQVTIYAKPSRCNIGLSNEGFYHVCKPCKSCLPIPRIAIGEQSFMQMTWTAA